MLDTYIARGVRCMSVEDGFFVGQPGVPRISQYRECLWNRWRRVRDHSCKNGAPLWMKLKDKFGHDAKVASRAANCPK